MEWEKVGNVMETKVEAQGGGRDETTRENLTYTGAGTEQVAPPEETRADVSAHSFWKRGTTAIFDVLTTNLESGSYLCTMTEKALEK